MDQPLDPRRVAEQAASVAEVLASTEQRVADALRHLAADDPAAVAQARALADQAEQGAREARGYVDRLRRMAGG